MMWIGASLILVGSIVALFKRSFLSRLHAMGVSDISGSIVLLLGIAFEGFEIPKLILAVLFLATWSPMVTHMLAKLHIKRMGK